MEDAAKESGFRVIAAVAEHSIISRYAAGRPDASDEAQLADFADRILRKDGEAAALAIKKACSVRKENELFL